MEASLRESFTGQCVSASFLGGARTASLAEKFTSALRGVGYSHSHSKLRFERFGNNIF